jgi:hypothetical protein
MRWKPHHLASVGTDELRFNSIGANDICRIDIFPIDESNGTARF